MHRRKDTTPVTGEWLQQHGFHLSKCDCCEVDCDECCADEDEDIYIRRLAPMPLNCECGGCFEQRSLVWSAARALALVSTLPNGDENIVTLAISPVSQQAVLHLLQNPLFHQLPPEDIHLQN